MFSEILEEKENMKLEDMKEKEEIILRDPVVAFITSKWKEAKHCNSLFLTGGAVIDLLEGRKPKDYDFCLTSASDFNKIIKGGVELGLNFNYTSATAVSFTWEGNDIQVLRKNPSEFPFTIEMSKFSIRESKFESFDNVSFSSKILIPNDALLFNNTEVTRTNFLNRVSKWESKGYKIHPVTKRSYIKLTKHKTFLQKIEKFFTRKESKES